MSNFKISLNEFKIISIICIIFSLRMLGLFMVLPVLSTDGLLLKHSTKLLVGLSIGIYSFTQLIFQIPFGYFSDKIGRKKIIILGLLFFFVGSIIAATTLSIWGIFIGRMLQGSGAISSSLTALLYDSIVKKNYTFGMLCLGITFVITFIVSLVISPIIVSSIGLQGLFKIISLLAFISIILAMLFIHDSKIICFKKQPNMLFLNSIKILFKNYYLLKLLYIVFLINYVLMANFVVFPEILLKLNFSKYESYKLYLITTIISIVVTSIVFYNIRMKEIKHIILSITINILLLSQVILFCVQNNFKMLFLGIQLFFISFFLISSILSSEINKIQLFVHRGFILSIYNTKQLLGMALGSSISGGIYGSLGIKYVFLVNVSLILMWYFISLTKKFF